MDKGGGATFDYKCWKISHLKYNKQNSYPTRHPALGQIQLKFLGLTWVCGSVLEGMMRFKMVRSSVLGRKSQSKSMFGNGFRNFGPTLHNKYKHHHISTDVW